MYRKRKSFPVTQVAAVLLAAATLFLLWKGIQLTRINEDLRVQQQSLQEENQRLQQEIADLTHSSNGVQEHGRLTVSGTQLLDEQGEPVVLRGISSHGVAWYSEYTNYRSLATWKEYGANAFRIAMYVAQNDGYLEEPELNQKLLYSAIENALAADLYAIVDWHVLRDENPNYHVEEAIEVLEEVARHYGDNPGIIYEICNEPNGDTSYEDIVRYADQVIPAIRKYAPHAIILVGTPNFCTSLSEAVENPIQHQNILYTYHYYAGISDCEFAIEEVSHGIENGLPVFVSEWGLDSHHTTEQHWEDTTAFLDFLADRQIGWINWSLSNKDEGYSLLPPEEERLSGWEPDDLTDIGRFVLQYFSDATE